MTIRQTHSENSSVSVADPPRSFGSVLRQIWAQVGPWFSFLVPLAIYAATAIPLTMLFRERLNIDAVCYIRRAMYLVHGDFYHSISGYWSPLISWCIAPLLLFRKMDPVYAAHTVMCVSGAVLVVAFGLFLRRFANFGHILNMLAMCVVAIVARNESLREITPDVLMAACMMLYLWAMLSPNLLRRRRAQLLAGALGGVAYLAKAYALPFVLMHMPLTIAIRAWVARREARSAQGPTSKDARPFLQGAAALAVGILGFALVAGPWIGTLSWRYRGLTFSTVASRAHAVARPRNGHPQTGWPAPGPYILEFENPELLPYHFWSPLDSDALFREQLGIIRNNTRSILNSTWDFDLLGLGLIAFFAAPLALLPVVQRPGQRWKTLWLFLSMAIYCAGFLPIFFIPRYINPLILPLALTLALSMAMFWGGVSARLMSIANLVRVALAVTIMGSFLFWAVHEWPKDIGSPAFRMLASQMRKRGVNGPIVSSNSRFSSYVAFFLGHKYIYLRGRDADAIDLKLRDLNVAAVVIWDQPERDRPRDMALVRRPTWRRLPGIFEPGVEVYVRPPKDQPAKP